MIQFLSGFAHLLTRLSINSQTQNCYRISFNQKKVAEEAKNKNYTEEFKKQIIELYENDKIVKELSGEYGLAKQTVYKWQKHYGAISKTEEGEAVTQADVKAMKRRIAELKMEN